MSKLYQDFEAEMIKAILKEYQVALPHGSDFEKGALWAFKWLDTTHLISKWNLMTERDLLISSIKQAKEILGDDCGYPESCGCASCRAYNILDQFLEKRNV